jgi:hypothetical protein
VVEVSYVGAGGVVAINPKLELRSDILSVTNRTTIGDNLAAIPPHIDKPILGVRPLSFHDEIMPLAKSEILGFQQHFRRHCIGIGDNFRIAVLNIDN